MYWLWTTEDWNCLISQIPRRKQWGIKLEAPQGAGYLTLAAVAKCLRAVTWLVARGNKTKNEIRTGEKEWERESTIVKVKYVQHVNIGVAIEHQRINLAAV